MARSLNPINLLFYPVGNCAELPQVLGSYSI